MNSFLASPGVRVVVVAAMVIGIVVSEGRCVEPGRFVAHVKQRAAESGEPLRRVVRITLVAPRSAWLAMFGYLLIWPATFDTWMAPAGGLLIMVALVGLFALPLVDWSPVVLRRRWMEGLDVWWNQPELAIQRLRLEQRPSE